MSVAGPTNDQLADVFEDVGQLLRQQAANPWRIKAWEDGAFFLRQHGEPASAVLARVGHKALVALPHIGDSLASAIEELVHTGDLALLRRLRGEVSPEDLFTTLPGVGEGLARRIHETLHLETLEALELAAHDGSLERVPGIGRRRAAAIRDTLHARLSRSARRRSRAVAAHEDGPVPLPPAELILEIDRRYRSEAEDGTLPTVAPRRFNPTGESWLPVLHESHDGWHFTAMYSNTARAHELDRTRDWVVLYFDHDGAEDQCTVVTEYRGPLAGRRVIRGREAECAQAGRPHD